MQGRSAPSATGRAALIVDACPETGWEGTVWRAHKFGQHRGTTRTARDFAYTVGTIGRWHGGLDHPDAVRFPALYTSLQAHVAEAEFLRHLDDRTRSSGHIDLRRDRFRLSQLVVKLSRVVDLCHLEATGMTCEVLCRDTDYTLPQRLAAEAYGRGAEGILVWSCAVDPVCSQVNLIVFANGLLSGSSVEESGVWSQIRPLQQSR